MLSTVWPLSAEVFASSGSGPIGGMQGTSGLTFLPDKLRLAPWIE